MVKLYIEFRWATNCLIRSVANLFYVVVKRREPSENGCFRRPFIYSHYMALVPNICAFDFFPCV